MSEHWTEADVEAAAEAYDAAYWGACERLPAFIEVGSIIDDMCKRVGIRAALSAVRPVATEPIEGMTGSILDDYRTVVEVQGYEERDGRKFSPDVYVFLKDIEDHVEYLEERIKLLQQSYLDAEKNLIAAERERVPGVSVEKWQRIYRSDLHPDDRAAIRDAVAAAKGERA